MFENDKRTSWNKGLKMSDESRKRTSELTKAAMTESVKNKIREKAKGRIMSKETKAKIALFQKNRIYTDEEKKNISVGVKNSWAKLSLDERRVRLRKMHAKRASSSTWRKSLSDKAKERWKIISPEQRTKQMKYAFSKIESPNKLERECIEIFKKNNIQLEFVGNCSFWIDKWCPDFVDKENKIVVEVFCNHFKVKNYGSVEKYKIERNAQFAGWKVLYYSYEQVFADDFAKIVTDDIDKLKK